MSRTLVLCLLLLGILPPGRSCAEAPSRRAVRSGSTNPVELLSTDEREETWTESIPGGPAVAPPIPAPEPWTVFRPAIVDVDGAFPQTSAWEWQLLPKGVLYHTYWASQAEPRMGVQVVDINGVSGPFVDSHIAGRVPIVRFGSREQTEGWQFDILGGASLRQDNGNELDVQAVDFRYDLLLTHAIGPHRWKFGFYHVSSHTGDEYLLKNQNHVRLNFFRDTLVMGYSYYAIPELRLYGEVGYSFNHEISKPLEFQFGFDYGPAGKTGPWGAPFLAMNGHLREEVDFGGNLALQAGWAWRADGMNTGTLRTGLYYYDGKSSQFSFYNRYERQIGWGLWYDY